MISAANGVGYESAIMAQDTPSFDAEHSGNALVVRILDQHALVYPNSVRTKQDVGALLENSGCHVLRLELKNVQLIASDFLGFLLTLVQQGIAVQLRDLAPNLREQLQITQLDQLLEVYEHDET